LCPNERAPGRSPAATGIGIAHNPQHADPGASRPPRCSRPRNANAEADVAANAKDTAQRGPTHLKRQAQGSALAVGLVAFGVGALAAALFPATQQQKDATGRLKQQVTPTLESVKETATQGAQELKDNLQPAAQDAAESVKATAKDAKAATTDHAQVASTAVKQEVTDSAATVQQHASEAKDSVQDQAGSSRQSNF
jgi:hypothetical protein